MRILRYSEINESIRDYLKPKAKEDIDKSLDALSPEDALKNSCVNGYLEGVRKAIARGADPSIHYVVVKSGDEDEDGDGEDEEDYDYNYLEIALMRGHNDIVKELLKIEKVRKGLTKSDKKVLLKYLAVMVDNNIDDEIIGDFILAIIGEYSDKQKLDDILKKLDGNDRKEIFKLLVDMYYMFNDKEKIRYEDNGDNYYDEPNDDDDYLWGEDGDLEDEADSEAEDRAENQISLKEIEDEINNLENDDTDDLW